MMGIIRIIKDKGITFFCYFLGAGFEENIDETRLGKNDPLTKATPGVGS